MGKPQQKPTLGCKIQPSRWWPFYLCWYIQTSL